MDEEGEGPRRYTKTFTVIGSDGEFFYTSSGITSNAFKSLEEARKAMYLTARPVWFKLMAEESPMRVDYRSPPSITLSAEWSATLRRK